MGGVCCCNNAITNGGSDPNLIIDVEKVLKEKAWNTFCIAHGKIERRFLKRKDYEIEVPMNYYNFEVVDRHISGRTPRQEGATGLGRNGGESQLAGKGLAHGDQTSAGHFGLETEFNNDTAQKQTYTFQFEKTRMASIEVNYQRGYSIGTKANFSIGLPKVLGDGSVEFGMDKQIQVTKATGEKFEDSVRTMATSEIVVPPWTRYIASVIMEEQSLLANFTIVVKMSMPAKKAPVYIKDRKTGEVIFVRSVSNLSKDFKDKAETVMGEDNKVRPDAIRFVLDGVISGVQLSTHKINLHSDSSVDASGNLRKSENNNSIQQITLDTAQDDKQGAVGSNG